MDKRKDVIAILNFLKELGSLRTRTVNDIKDEPWSLFLDTLPVETDEITVNYRDRVDEEKENLSPVLMSVHNPALQEAQKPPDHVLTWFD